MLLRHSDNKGSLLATHSAKTAPASVAGELQRSVYGLWQEQHQLMTELNSKTARLEAVRQQTQGARVLADKCRLLQSSESSHERSYASSCSPEPTLEQLLPAEGGSSC